MMEAFNYIILLKVMLYTSPFCQAFNQMGNPFFPLYCYSQQQIHPTTILISNPESCQESEKQIGVLPKLITTQTSLKEVLDSQEIKNQVKKEGKVIKKQPSRKKDQNFGFRNQNKDRNMLSGILKGYIHFILHSRGMIKLIENLVKKRQIQNGVSGFYDFMSKTFPTKKTYVGIQYLQKVLSDGSEPENMRYILAVTIRHYFLEIYPLSLHQGSKLKKKLRLTLLKKARVIISMLFQI